MEIQIKDVIFNYKGCEDSPVLKGISVDIREPQVVSILGPNGVGKSTLIHCINRILEPTGGTVFLNGLDVSEYPLKEMAKHVGYVPCTSSDTFPLTVVDTVLLGRHPHAGWKTTDEDLEIVYTVLEKLEIQDLAMRYFNELSAGQHQKVMLARGLVQKPEVLLLDEPTSNLDIKHQLGITRTLRELSRSEGLLVIMISHDLNIAARYSDNIILMHEGRIFAVGTPKDVMTEENIRTVYGVASRIIDDNGRPYILVEDELLGEVAPLSDDAVCSSGEMEVRRRGTCAVLEVCPMDKKGMYAVFVVAIILIAAVAAIVVLNNGSKDNGEPKALDEADLKVFGNINGDRFLNDKDADMIEDLINDGKTVSEYPLADANQDGVLDSKDVDLVRAVAKGESARVYHINYHDVDGDGVMDEEVVSTAFPITSAIMTGSANSFILTYSLGIIDEIKGATYGSSNDKALFGGCYLDTTKTEKLGTSSSSIALEDGKVGSSNIIAEKHVTAVLSDWNRTYITNEADFRLANVDVVRVAAASIDSEVMTHSVMLLGLLFQKVDVADKLVDYNLKIYGMVDEAVSKVGDADKVKYLSSSMTGYVSSDSSDYGVLCIRAGGNSMVKDVDFGGSTATKIADHPEIYRNPIDVIVHLRTAVTYEQNQDALKSEWNKYIAGFSDAPNTTSQVMVSGVIPVSLRCAYVCAAFYPDLLSVEDVDALHQGYVETFYEKSFDMDSLKFLITAEDMS